LTNDNINNMEGDIVNEEGSIYDTAKTPVEKKEPKKPLISSKTNLLALKKYVPKLKVLIVLFYTILLICVCLLILSRKNQIQELAKENPIVQIPSPSPQADPKIHELTNKVEQFKKDIDESVVTKKLTPPAVDLNLDF